MKQPKDIDVRAHDFISNLIDTDKHSPYFTRVELAPLISCTALASAQTIRPCFHFRVIKHAAGINVGESLDREPVSLSRPGRREALIEAGRRMQAELARLGLTEEGLVVDFKRWRKVRRAR